MIGLKGTLNVIDNSGAIVAECIRVMSGARFARAGDEIVCVVKRARPINPNIAGTQAAAQKVKKGDVRHALVVRTKKEMSRPDGRTIRFDDNACILLNQKKEPLGTRVLGVVSAELRTKNWMKAVSLAPRIIALNAEAPNSMFGSFAQEHKLMEQDHKHLISCAHYTCRATPLSHYSNRATPIHDLRRSVADIFRIQVISNTDVRSPIVTLGSTSFFHVRHENLYIVAVTKWNANAALIFEFCYRVVNIGRSYFGKFDEEAVKNNFVLIYELLDEILDFGYPQNSETDTLKMYITTEGVKSERAAEDSSRITIQATGAISWRRNDIKYRKNEAFIDVIESVNLLMSNTGTVLRADVAGQILMRAYLSGTPECKFGLNDKLLLDKDTVNRTTARRANAVEIDDCQFHQCVKLGKFDNDRSISFVPPDGEFELMKYRTTENVNLPFKVHPVVTEIGNTRVEYNISVKANFSPKLYANNVVLKIPTPLNSAKVEVKVGSGGKAKYAPSENCIIWKIPRFQGQAEFNLSGEAELTSMTHKRVWSRPPISMDFQVLMFTSSGLLVRFLKVFEKSGYQSVKWVRYMTKAGSYQIRF
ncbi:AP-2 complex subunit mu-1 [Mucor ambiguus]|uniref:Large ribosomal subunit protein uL14m n=1 Tax=Mucor ambiguus TaxID=91626 RepID=A0A0C9MT11_9FUNG|nr:AP-2 complex subunit mu-1 [Mucor ambiguus]